MLRNKDVTTRRLYTYLTSKFTVAEQYVEAILWVIESQVPNAATLDRNKVSSILNHIKDTIGYPTWFTVNGMFKAAFILAAFDYYSVFHYRFLVEMSANYPEFNTLALEEQQELLNYRNYLVVATKLFDPNIRPADLLLLIEKICGYTSWDQTSQVKRERRELVFFRVTGVLAKFELMKVHEKKVGRPRNSDKKSSKKPPPPSHEFLKTNFSVGESPFTTTNGSNAASSAGGAVASDMAGSVLYKRPGETTMYAYYTKEQRTSVTSDTLADGTNEAAEAAYSCLCQEETMSSDDENPESYNSKGAAHIHCQPTETDGDEREQPNINNTNEQSSTSNANGKVQPKVAEKETYLDAMHRVLDHWKEQAIANQANEQAIINQATGQLKSAAEEEAKNARVKIFQQRLLVNTNDTSSTATTAPAAATDAATAVADSSNGSVLLPRNVASDLATVSSDEAPAKVFTSQLIHNGDGTSTARKISITEHSTNSHISSTSEGSAQVHQIGEPLHLVTQTPSCTVPVISNGMYPYDGLPIRPPLAYSALSFGLQSMHAVLNDHLGISYPHSYMNQRPPPSPAYDTHYPQMAVHSFSANPPISQGYHANSYNPYHATPFGLNDNCATHFGAMQYGNFHASASAPVPVPSFSPPANPFAQHFHPAEGYQQVQQRCATESAYGTNWQQQQAETVTMHQQQATNRMQQQLAPNVDVSSAADDSQYWTE